MRKITYLFISVLILLILNGCNSNTGDEDLFQFKGSYVGDNGAVGNILMALPTPNGEQLNGFELKTMQEPYGIIVNYKIAEEQDELDSNYQETALYNASFIFALTRNADWVRFNFVEEEIEITRDELQNWYGEDLREFKNEEELSKFIQKFLEDENKVNRFFD